MKSVAASGLAFSLFFLTSQISYAEICDLKQTHQVFVVGEAHGTEVAAQTQGLMTDAAGRKKIILGLEIDQKTLKQELQPKYANELFAMEEDFSKGYGVAHWAWWKISWQLLNYDNRARPEFIEAEGLEAVGSFTYFLGSNPYLQKAWARALPSLQVLARKSLVLNQVIESWQNTIAKPSGVENAKEPIPMNTRDAVAAVGDALKATLRAYREIALENKSTFAVPEKMETFKEVLDFPPIVKGERNYYIYYRWYWEMARSYQQALVVDWRSTQMVKNILQHLCSREERGLPNLPAVTIAGVSHIPMMESALKKLSQGKVQASLEVPPSHKSGDFQKLLDQLMQKP